MIEAVTESLAAELEIHESMIEVEVDMETGEVTYTITSDNLIDAQDAEFTLKSDVTQTNIADSIEEDINGATVNEVTVSDDIEMTVEFTVDTTDATEDLTQAKFETEQLLSDDMDTVVVESKSLFFLFVLFSY